MSGLERDSERRSFVIGAAWSFGSLASTLLLGYVASVILARSLGAADRGLLGVMNVVAGIGVTVLAFGTPFAVTYYGSRRPRYRPALLGNGIVTAALVGLVALALAAVFQDDLNRLFHSTHPSRLWLLVALLFPALVFTYWVSNLTKAEQEFRLLGTAMVAGRLATLVATVVIVAILGWGVAGGLVTLLAANVATVAVVAPRVFRGGIGFSRLLACACLRYGLRQQGGLLVDHANARLDVLILSFYASNAATGRYLVAQIVAEIVILLPTSIGTVLGPKVAASREDGFTAPVMRLNGTLTIASMIGVALVGPLLIVFGYGPDFREALQPFFLLLPGMWFLSASEVAREALRARGRPGTSSIIGAITVGATIALDFALIPSYAATGGAIASTIAYAVGGVTAIVITSRLLGVRPRTLLFTSPRETWAVFASVLRRS